jgi:hypothetical protein
VDGVEFWDILVLEPIPEQADDLRYEVTEVDRIDLIADTYYGDPTLWWVIAIRNDMEILPTDLNVGRKIVIPSPRYVRNQLFKQTKV